MTNPISNKSQFDLRSVFYVTFVVCALGAVFGPAIRGFRSGEWFLVKAIFQVATIVISLWLFARQREAACRQAGFKTFGTSFRQVAEYDSSREFSPLAYLFIKFSFLLLMVFALNSGSEASYGLLPGFFLAQLFLLVFVARRFWSLVWGIDHTDIEIGEYGLIHGGYQFAGWDEIAEARKSEHSNGVVAIDMKPGHGHSYCGLTLRKTWILRIIPELRDEILQRINAHLPSPKLNDSVKMPR